MTTSDWEVLRQLALHHPVPEWFRDEVLEALERAHPLYEPTMAELLAAAMQEIEADTIAPTESFEAWFTRVSQRALDSEH